MSIEVSQPGSTNEAIHLLSTSPAPFNSPTQLQYRSVEHLERAFDAERRHSQWVWAARDDAGEVVATVGGLRNGSGIVLDHFGARSMPAFRMALAAATEHVRLLPEGKLSLFAPAGLVADSRQVRQWTTAFTATGWQLLVERHHYEFAPGNDLGTGVPEKLRLAPLAGPDDPRLVSIHRDVMEGTLDAHDKALVQRIGLDAGTRESLDYLLDVDPWEYVHLAFADRPEPVGYVLWRATKGGRGYLAFVGVTRSARGRGYGRELLARATRGLIQAGSTTLIADTDHTNTPMVAAFADVGWPQTETRIDFDRSA